MSPCLDWPRCNYDERTISALTWPGAFFLEEAVILEYELTDEAVFRSSVLMLSRVSLRPLLTELLSSQLQKIKNREDGHHLSTGRFDSGFRRGHEKMLPSRSCTLCFRLLEFIYCIYILPFFPAWSSSLATTGQGSNHSFSKAAASHAFRLSPGTSLTVPLLLNMHCWRVKDQETL